MIMPRLQPAGFVERLLSSLFPKKLEVQVESEELPDGRITLHPVYRLAGQAIDPALVGVEPRQRILGYSVVVDTSVLAVLRQGTATLTRQKATECLHDLRRKGVAVRATIAETPAARQTAAATPSHVQEVRLKVTLTLNADDSLDVCTELVTEDGTVVAKPADLEELRRKDGWYVADGNRLHVATTDTEWDDVLLTGPPTNRLTGVSVPEFLKTLDTLERKLGRFEKDEALQALAVYGTAHENRATVDGDQDSIRVSPQLVYYGKDEHPLTPGDLSALQKSQGGYKRIAEGWIDVEPAQVEEYRKASKELRSRLGTLSSIEGQKIPETLLALQGQKQLRSSWKVCLSEAVKNLHQIDDRPAEVDFRLDVVDGRNHAFLEIVPTYNHDRIQLAHGDHLEARARRERWIRRPDTWIKVDDDKCKRIEAARNRLKLEPGANGFVFPASQREKVLEAFSLLGTIQESSSYTGFVSQLSDFDKIADVDLPATLRPGITFRPYQKQGFNWLAFLQRFGLNGILADDMGLGKTLQTLAILQRAKEQGQGKSPSLIICPTSVVNNWQSEAEKFFAECPVILYTGGNRGVHRRQIRRQLHRAHEKLAGPLVVTSYDIARRDSKELRQIPWLYVVVDEGHHIKNPDAQRTKAIKAIQGQHRLILTGTPIQNKLEELWSLFDFTMPGFLGTRKGFRDRYGRADEIQWDAIRTGPGNLKERIRPFVLRRLKESVAKDLPQKILVDQKIELSPLQVELYERVLASADYQRVFDEIAAKGVERSKVLILKIYTTLRAICNHPVLAREEHQGDTVNNEDSGKLECLKELMEEIRDGEHRALLFCQSTQMLDIIGDFFRQWDHPFIRLDGNTPPPVRPELVREFNANTAIRCFLISTKAGGTGLNLTGADTVIFYDHDWNPANDHQAQDRAYRIGQTKPVTVYRLISQGTIEEKILQRQELKQTLADEIIGADEEGFKDLGRDELLGLFRLDKRQGER
jgi:SNF2 family DNA or RNA helicase